MKKVLKFIHLEKYRCKIHLFIIFMGLLHNFMILYCKFVLELNWIVSTKCLKHYLFPNMCFMMYDSNSIKALQFIVLLSGRTSVSNHCAHLSSPKAVLTSSNLSNLSLFWLNNPYVRVSYLLLYLFQGLVHRRWTAFKW